MTNIVPFKRKAAPNPQIEYQEFLHSVLFMHEVANDLLSKLFANNPHETKLQAYCDKHLATVRNFITQ